jgi:hypothetical protein
MLVDCEWRWWHSPDPHAGIRRQGLGGGLREFHAAVLRTGDSV